MKYLKKVSFRWFAFHLLIMLLSFGVVRTVSQYIYLFGFSLEVYLGVSLGLYMVLALIFAFG